TLRSLTLTGLVFLLLDPLLNFISSKLEYPSVSVFYDTSLSMKQHLDESELNYSDIKQNVNEWIDENKLNPKTYYFGEKFRKISTVSEISLDDQFTDFTELPNIISLNNSKINFLFSDGIFTAGADLNSISFDKQLSVYSFGFGSLNAENDIRIANVEYPRSIIVGDSVALDISIEASIENDLLVQVMLINNDDKIIHSIKKNINKGSSFVDVSMNLNSDDLTEQMMIKIVSDLQEIEKENNKWSFNLNLVSKKQSVLLISGALSSNTGFIKAVLQNLPQVEVTHIYRKNIGNWNKDLNSKFNQNHEIIILDDFPNNYLDKSQFDKISSYAELNGISILYFEGPNSNLQSAKLIAEYFGISAVLQRKPVLLVLEAGNLTQNLLTDLSVVEMFPPQQKIHSWALKQNNGYSIVKYSDASLAIYQNQLRNHSITGVFMPELSKTHFKLSTTEQEKSLYELCYDIVLSELISEDKLINIHTSKPSYCLGDQIDIDVMLNPHLSDKPTDVNLIVASDGETSEIQIPLHFNEKKQSYNCDFIADKSGSFEIFTKAKWENGQTTNSKPQKFIVQAIHTELKNLIQNRTGLQRIASLTGGIYNNIIALDSLLNHLKITPLEKYNDYHLSSISFYRYWWIFIVLLTAEWIIRKKIGLL
ncbi:MAG: hypothetical protein ISS11_07990, partial [Candidatus Marinimicrobia bacterium]|nr:hypothetical protein [Candidatus Neomarinimicrobiota bacterium]